MLELEEELRASGAFVVESSRGVEDDLLETETVTFDSCNSMSESGPFIRLILLDYVLRVFRLNWSQPMAVSVARVDFCFLYIMCLWTAYEKDCAMQWNSMLEGVLHAQACFKIPLV